jgi:hypothetical protein
MKAHNLIERMFPIPIVGLLNYSEQYLQIDLLEPALERMIRKE